MATAKLQLIGVNLKGENGADGMSAYEIAVKNGFEGTEAEWLESLKGEAGTGGGGGTTVYIYSFLLNGFYDLRIFTLEDVQETTPLYSFLNRVSKKAIHMESDMTSSKPIGADVTSNAGGVLVGNVYVLKNTHGEIIELKSDLTFAESDIVYQGKTELAPAGGASSSGGTKLYKHTLSYDLAAINVHMYSFVFYSNSSEQITSISDLMNAMRGVFISPMCETTGLYYIVHRWLFDESTNLITVYYIASNGVENSMNFTLSANEVNFSGDTVTEI